MVIHFLLLHLHQFEHLAKHLPLSQNRFGCLKNDMIFYWITHLVINIFRWYNYHWKVGSANNFLNYLSLYSKVRKDLSKSFLSLIFFWKGYSRYFPFWNVNIYFWTFQRGKNWNLERYFKFAIIVLDESWLIYSLCNCIYTQEKYEKAMVSLAETEKRVVIAESMLEATLQYESGQSKAQISPRYMEILLASNL